MRHALLTVAWTLLLGSPSWACSYAPPIDCYSVSPASRSPSSGPAFVGTVLEVAVLDATERSPTPSFLDRVQVKFRLDEPLSALPAGLREMEVFAGQVFRTTTDADGLYAFRDLPAGQFTGATSPETRANRGTITQHRCVQRDLYVLPPAPQP